VWGYVVVLHKLVSLEKAHELIEASILVRPPTEVIPVYRSYWRISASSIVARRGIPSRPLAAMDGYAVRLDDLKSFERLRLVGELKPGDEPPELGPGESYYVHMGAPVPLGADAISRVEATRVESGYVKPLEPLKPGKDIMDVGEVVAEGSTVVRAGEVISPYKVTVLMMLGFMEVPVYRVRVGVLSVGDEIDRYDSPSGKPVIDSIAPMVVGLLRFAEPVYLGVVVDDVNEIRRVVEEGVESLDALLTIGGASVGDTDNVKRVLASIGNLLFPGVSVSILKRGSVAVVDGKPIVTLPGQCVSAALVLHEFFLHTLSKMVGGEMREYVEAELLEDVEVKHRMDTAYLFELAGGKAKPLKWGVGLCMDLAKATAYTVLKRGYYRKGERLVFQKLVK
jgi:molybdopterin molybdotransferase